MSVKIGGKDVSFQVLHGIQKFQGREYLALRHEHPTAPRITITDTVPIEQQLELAAEQAVEMSMQEGNAETIATCKLLDELGLDYTLDRSPLPGTPLLLPRSYSSGK